MTTCDVLIVGSGASAVHAAVPLVEAGLQVVMLDVGHEDLTYEQLIPPAPFVDIRRSDPNQHRYFLGDRFEGIPLSAVGSGPQVTPPRAYVLQDTERLAPRQSPNFDALESHALGGLGRAWGAVSFPFNDAELSRCGLPVEPLRRYYEIVARRIGVSGSPDDDLRAMRGPLSSLQRPLGLDHNATALLTRYARVRERSLRAGTYMGQSMLAVLADALEGREANAHRDMDFWSNAGHSVYRPNITLRELQRRPNFSYRPGILVSRFEEIGTDAVGIVGTCLANGAEERVTARRLVLGAGSLGTTRIVLRSLEMYDRPVPFACNSHTYVPCLNYRGLGTAHAARCHSLAQLTVINDPTRDGAHLVQAQMYSYRSLQLFRLLNDAPLPHRQGVRILRALAPHLVIWVIQHEDAPDRAKRCVLRRAATATGDTLAIDYEISPEERARQVRDEKTIANFVKQLGCWPLRQVHAPHGASVHYAGQFPMTEEDRPLTTTPDGRLRGTRAVYLADGSTLAYLPAKGPTLTLMANAHRIGAGICEQLRA